MSRKRVAEINKFFAEMSDEIGRGAPLTRANIYSYLSMYGVKKGEERQDISTISRSVFRKVQQMVDLYSSDKMKKTGQPSDLSFSYQDQVNSSNQPVFRHMFIEFEGKEQAPSRDEIKLYVPIKKAALEKNATRLYEFMIKNRISSNSKLSEYNRADLFVVRVHDKESAQRIIDFCNSDKEMKAGMDQSNPFVPTSGKVGVARDTWGQSYNGFVADTLHEYCKVAKRQLNYSDFVKYCSMYEKAYSDNPQTRGNKTHYMYKTLKNALQGIESDREPLEEFSDKYNLKYDKEYFRAFTKQRDNNGYCYLNNETKEVIRQGHPDYLKLQAMNCLNKMYKEYNPNNTAVPSYEVNQKLVRSILSDVDRTLDGDGFRVMPTYITSDSKIVELYPDLCAYCAQQYRGIHDINQQKLVRNTVQPNMILRQGVLDKKFEPALKTSSEPVKEYTVGDKEFRSSIDIISVKGASIGIEFLEQKVKGYDTANITVVTGKNITKYLNAQIGVDRKLLTVIPENQKYAEAYRAGIANMLKQEDSEFVQNAGNIGIFEFKESKMKGLYVQRYLHPEHIKKLHDHVREGYIKPEVVQEER